MRYRLGELLGSGGFAEVFRATVEDEPGEVAVKRIRSGLGAAERACMLREALIGTKLKHENIASTRDFYWDERGRLCLVTELVDGLDLARVLERAGALPEDVALHIIRAVLNALKHAHGAGLVHRDVSPHNVLISWTGEVKLGDFGIAKPGRAAATTGTIRGTPHYLAPELLEHAPADCRSDLFAVGVILYEMLVGERPTIEELIAGAHHARCEGEFAAVIRRLLARDREERFPSAQAVLDELPDVDAQAELAARMAELQKKPEPAELGEVGPLNLPAYPPGEEPRRPPHHQWSAMALAIAAAVLVLGWAAYSSAVAALVPVELLEPTPVVRVEGTVAPMVQTPGAEQLAGVKPGSAPAAKVVRRVASDEPPVKYVSMDEWTARGPAIRHKRINGKLVRVDGRGSR